MIDRLSFFLIPSRNSSTPLYPQSAASRGVCSNFLLFRCFHLRLTFEFLEEVGNASGKLIKTVDTFFNNANLIICKTSSYWQNLPMHFQIVDLSCKNYNVKCGYCNCEIFFAGNPLLPLWTI